MTDTIDAAQLPAMLNQLRLPTIARLWPAITQIADRESWPAARTMAALFEHEIAERAQRRTARHLLEARLPVGKTIDRFDFSAVPSVSKARVMALAEGDAWLAKGTNILLFGPPGVGKSHLGAALGHAMIDAGYRVLFTRTTDLVQHLQAARQDLKLASAIEKLDKYHLLVLDDLSYVQKSQAETSVIFELIAARYERRSLLVTANQPFGAWDAIFPDPAMTVAAIDRLVHHSVILEMNTDSYRHKSAETKRPAKSAATPGQAAIGAQSVSRRHDWEWTMPRKSIGDRAMTDAERQARCRAQRTAGKPAFRVRRPTDHRSRAQRWRDAVAELIDLQAQYAAWFDRLPDNLRENATAEGLQAICDFDLAELQAIEPPRGFGRD